MKRLTFRAQNTDGTCCADVTLFPHVTSGGLSPIAEFYLCRFLRCIGFNLFFRSKTAFFPNIMPLNTLKKFKLTLNG